MTTAYDLGNVPPIEVRHRLRIAREFAGLEQVELAEMIGVSRNTVGNLEKGHTTPRKIVMNAWALATGVPVGWLENGETPAGPDAGPDGGGESHPGESNPRPIHYKSPNEAITGSLSPAPVVPLRPRRTPAGPRPKREPIPA